MAQSECLLIFFNVVSNPYHYRKRNSLCYPIFYSIRCVRLYFTFDHPSKLDPTCQLNHPCTARTLGKHYTAVTTVVANFQAPETARDTNQGRERIFTFLLRFERLGPPPVFSDLAIFYLNTILPNSQPHTTVLVIEYYTLPKNMILTRVISALSLCTAALAAPT
jgi:hypothetical protein